MPSSSILFRRGIWIWIFLLIALRFLFWKDTIFILDEPLFQMKIDDYFAGGAFPLSTFRGSSIPLPYGAGAVWFYMLIRLFTWHPYAIVLYHTTAVTFGVLLFLKAMLQKFGEESARWSGLLLATSPLLFYLSRHPWDNTLLFTLNAVVVWSLVQLEKKKREYFYHGLMGAAVGYALNIHLMYGPVAVALGLTLLYRSWKLYGFKSKLFWLPILIFGATAFLMLVPYLWEAYRIMQVEQPLEHTKYTKRWGDGRNLWWLLQR
jgi:4-amino-4-deoxy-L-arabinose transferase-like glycosyltransferase